MTDERSAGEIAMTAKARVGLALRVDPALHSILRDEAASRGLTINAFVEKLLVESIDRLIPADEFTLTRSDP